MSEEFLRKIEENFPRNKKFQAAIKAGSPEELKIAFQERLELTARAIEKWSDISGIRLALEKSRDLIRELLQELEA